MPTFDFTAPNGRQYSVEGPDGATPEQAFAILQQHGGGDGPRGPQQSYSQPEGYLDAAVQGIPIVGPLLQKGGAAAAAAIQPLMGQNDGTTFGQRYDANLGELQKRSEQFGQEHPIGSTAAGLAGGTGAMMLTGGIAPGAMSAMGLGGGPLLGSMAKGAASGAAIGALDANVRGSDPTSSSAWGAAFGGLAPVAGAVIGKAAGAVANRVSRPVASAENVALQKVAQPLTDEGMTTPEAVQAKLDSVGPEATLLDANPRLAQMGGAIAASPGEGQQILRSAIEDRAASAPDRITAQVDNTMGKPVDLERLSQGIYQQAKQEAGPLYAEAYKAPVQSTQELQDVLASPFGKNALLKARSLALSDTSAPPSAMFAKGTSAPSVPLPDWAQGVMAKGGEPAERLTQALRASGVIQDAQPAVDARGLHLVRQAYDDMISAARRQGNSNKARILNQGRSVIDNTLKSVPEMAQADSVYADMSRIREAMKNGQNVFKNSEAPEDIASALRGMSAAEREAYIQGGRVAVRNTMGTARNDAAAARAMFSKEFNQEKLRLLLGDEGADAILHRIGAEQAYAAVAPRVIGNSETAGRALAKADLADAHGIPSYRDVAVFSGTHGVIRRAVAGAIESTIKAATEGRQKDIETHIAKLLTATGAGRTKAIEALMQTAVKRDPSGRTYRLIAAAVARLPQASAGRGDPSAKQSGQVLPAISQ